MNIVLQFQKKSPKIYEQITSEKENVNIETIKNDKVVKPPWVPKLGLKLRQEFKKFGIKTIFTSGRNLKNLICR